jgi:hypothetical protein
MQPETKTVKVTRTAVSNTRMTPREKRRLAALAKEAGVSESDWTRMTINKAYRLMRRRQQDV